MSGVKKRPHSPSPQSTPATPNQNQNQVEDTYTSTPLSDRKSTFLATFSPTLPAKTLQSLPDITSATHRIAAWRKPSPQQSLPLPSSSGSSGNSRTIYTTGYDDDGEKFAGKRLVRVLEEMGVEQGSVVCARWFGGVMLGPVRFVHIEGVVREAILKWKNQGKVEEEERKRRKVEEKMEGDKERLVGELGERDRSIEVLRGLLREKKEGKKKDQANGNTKDGGEDKETDEKPPDVSASQATASPSKTIDYSKMSLDALRRMDKARDKTIAWLLKEIDQAEIENGVAELDEALQEQEKELQERDGNANGSSENG